MSTRGPVAPFYAIRATISGKSELADAFDRCREALRSSGVDLEGTRAMLGSMVTLDTKQSGFVGEFADAANALARRTYYRKPHHKVPETTTG